MRLEPDEALQGAHDLDDLGTGSLRQRDPVVELRPGLRVDERELGRAQQGDERIRELVQCASGQAAQRGERAFVVGAVRHWL